MTIDEAEAALAEWQSRSEQVDRDRDHVVRAAHQAGMNIRQIHIKSGIGRSTIYRILGLDPEGSRAGLGRPHDQQSARHATSGQKGC